jgi:hypothetical protein
MNLNFISFGVIDVASIADAEAKYVIVIEFYTNIHDRMYLVKLPILHHTLERGLRYYKNIIN